MATPQEVIDKLTAISANLAAKVAPLKEQAARVPELEAQIAALQSAPAAPSISPADLDPILIAAEAVEDVVDGL